ncbi:MAG: excinuclease ABC subunit UvrC [Algiphilus sp.]
MTGSAFDSKAFLAQLTTAPGVYRMYDANEALLYVGKARNLRKRVGSYFLRASGNPRIEAMVDQIARVEVTVTHSEDEALLLEATLIKEQRPRYNILYRDDKSYPYVRITHHAYPRIAFYRGQRNRRDQFFGPFPSAASVKETLDSLQRLFQLRPCRDTYFNNRTRPCLQHQIKRCSAPCVGRISEEDYARDVERAKQLLNGRADTLMRELEGEMHSASQSLAFERAARLRDQIAALNRIQQQRGVTGGTRNTDVIALAPHAGRSALVVMSVRDGLNLGHRSFFPRHGNDVEPDELMESFLSQHYAEHPPPREILVSHPVSEEAGLPAALSARSGHSISIRTPQRGFKRKLLEMAAHTAAQALSTHLTEAASMDQRLVELAERLGLPAPPNRIECFDISHTGGEGTVASCVVFDASGAVPSAYRRYNIRDITPGDDYAAIQQAVHRRFRSSDDGERILPELLLIDGGKGQVTAALNALAERDVDTIPLFGVAKGVTRKPGLEELIPGEGGAPFRLPADSPALHLIQQIRDEAHRFAIAGHRARRGKARTQSQLEDIEGLGPARRRALLNHFGGITQVRAASVDSIAKVQGISRTLAARIHAALR